MAMAEATPKWGSHFGICQMEMDNNNKKKNENNNTMSAEWKRTHENENENENRRAALFKWPPCTSPCPLARCLLGGVVSRRCACRYCSTSVASAVPQGTGLHLWWALMGAALMQLKRPFPFSSCPASPVSPLHPPRPSASIKSTPINTHWWKSRSGAHSSWSVPRFLGYLEGCQLPCLPRVCALCVPECACVYVYACVCVCAHRGLAFRPSDAVKLVQIRMANSASQMWLANSCKICLFQPKRRGSEAGGVRERGEREQGG